MIRVRGLFVCTAGPEPVSAAAERPPGEAARTPSPPEDTMEQNKPGVVVDVLAWVLPAASAVAGIVLLTGWWTP